MLVLLGLLALPALAVFAWVMSARTIEDLVHSGNDAAATFTRALVEQEFEHWQAALASHAGFPTLSAAIAAGEVGPVRERLEVMVTAHPQLDRAFVSDTAGVLWVDYPVAPESLGLDFSARDWFQGVRAAAAPYVSHVYERNAEPRRRVVAVATPVSDPETGEVAGYLVVQVLLANLSSLLSGIEVGASGIALLVDHEGTLVAHPALDAEGDPVLAYGGVRATGASPVGRERYTDPLTGEEVLASIRTARVGSHAWTVVAQQPVGAAFAGTRALALRLGTAGVVLTFLLGITAWVLAREAARRRVAEEALEAANRELERRVEKRTRELREREEELAQARRMEAVGRLAGGVAHDFNNLLTVILGSCELMLDSVPEDSPERVEMEQVHAAGQRAAELTRQLLAFSRKQVMKPRVIDVNAGIERMRGLLERVLGEHISLEFHLATELHPVLFDPGQLEQVVMNLVVNARDAMPGGGRLTIRTSNVEIDDSYVEEHPGAQTGPHVMLAVSDTGLGMDAETRRRIFEPFFTTKRLGRGTGLGLSTVYGIVRQGGGTIWTYSEPGRGTTFKVYLPRTDRVPAPPREPPAPEESRGDGTVLVVEDEDTVRRLVVRVLEGAGYRVLPAGSAAQANAVVTGPPDPGGIDLLLTDVVLPDLSGPELADDLRTRVPGLRVLYMSGYTDDVIAHHGALDPSIDFIEKPLRVRDLLTAVNRALRTRAG